MNTNESLRELIKDMVDKEDPQNPLSDNDIVVRLKDKGVMIARRTITKHRIALDIPVASQRKKW